jgi:hypothetical protein
VNIEGSKVLVLGGYGLVGTAVCRELLTRRPAEIQIHSLRLDESERAREELTPEAGSIRLSVSAGDLFGLAEGGSRRERIWAQLAPLDEARLDRFVLYRLLVESRPAIVVDCINTATAIAYRDTFSAAERLFRETAGDSPGAADGAVVDAAEALLEALYTPRLIRHLQLMYRGMIEAGTRVYAKIGTTGTGGMGLNIPYTHSEERPSRVLLAKSAIAGAHSLLLFAMARTPGAPITKEIKPAAAIAWKRIGYGPIVRRGEPIHLVDARPLPLGERLSSHDPAAARVRDEVLESVFIDTGENGIFSLEEFSTVTSCGQMEFVTPEEIAGYLVYEIEGGNTGRDVVAALDGAVLGPTYRAALLRRWAIERMSELERRHGVQSVAFEMLGPPRISKLLFEAHLLREAFGTGEAVRAASAAAIRDALDALVREHPETANRIAAVGVPLLLDSGEVIRGPKILVPGDADGVEVTADRLESWVRNGWVDLRLANCARWLQRFVAIRESADSLPDDDTSSRYLRNRDFWTEDGGRIHPGKIVGWILSVEEHGERWKR